MSTRRGISILAVLVAMAMALAAAPTWASKVAAPSHAGYRTPAPTTQPSSGNNKPPPSGQGQGPITGGGGMAPKAGTQPVVAGAPARSGQGPISASTGNKPAVLPASGGAARGGW